MNKEGNMQIKADLIQLQYKKYEYIDTIQKQVQVHGMKKTKSRLM